MSTPLRARSARRTTAGLALGALLLALTACSGSQSVGHDAVPAAPMTEVAPQVGAPARKSPTLPDELHDEQRNVVKTASLTLSTDDATGAADKAVAFADAAGGRVDNRTESGSADAGPTYVTLLLRVPAERLDGVITDLKTLGTVQNLQIGAEDVTQQRVDLDARIAALQTSVDRLLAIMRDARDPDALIKAEDALSTRQADLDSLRAQRTALGNRIQYSSINVDLTSTRVPTPVAHGGFLGQLQRGWEALVAAASYAVLTFGLLLPWLLALAVGAGVVYLLVRMLSRRGSAPDDGAPAADAPAAADSADADDPAPDGSDRG